MQDDQTHYPRFKMSNKQESYFHALKAALLEDGGMNLELYHRNLEPKLSYLRRSLKKEMEDYLFCLVCNRLSSADQYQVAMVLIEKKDKHVRINEAARDRLKQLWVGENYVNNMNTFLPSFAEDIVLANWSVNGISVVHKPKPRVIKGFGA